MSGCGCKVRVLLSSFSAGSALWEQRKLFRMVAGRAGEGGMSSKAQASEFLQPRIALCKPKGSSEPLGVVVTFIHRI